MSTKDESELVGLAELLHELEAPLVSLEVQLGTLTTAAACHEVAERCLDEVRALRGLVANVVPFTRGALDPSAFSLGPILERLGARFRPKAEASGVALRIEKTSLTASGDPLATEHVLSNLIDNGLKFTPRGGSVRVRAVARDGRVRAEVVDDGPGLTVEERELAFRPFFRANREAPGFGLGLTVAKRFAERQGGELTVERAANGGACFTLVLAP